VAGTVGPKKSPSGLAPEGQSRENDQNPRGAPVTAEMTTTERATTERWALREAEIVVPLRFM
jgi:hypothetical protein